jgi:hypothetical protein
MWRSRDPGSRACLVAASERYIWIARWDEFQTYTKKRNKPWAPPWIKTFPSQLDDDTYWTLTGPQRLLIRELRELFSKTRGKVPVSTSYLSRSLGVRVTIAMLDSLNDAGLIEFCSGTVREQRWNAFVNCSALEVEIEVEIEPKAVVVSANGERPWDESFSPAEPPVDLETIA